MSALHVCNFTFGYRELDSSFVFFLFTAGLALICVHSMDAMKCIFKERAYSIESQLIFKLKCFMFHRRKKNLWSHILQTSISGYKRFYFFCSAVLPSKRKIFVFSSLARASSSSFNIINTIGRPSSLPHFNFKLKTVFKHETSQQFFFHFQFFTMYFVKTKKKCFKCKHGNKFNKIKFVGRMCV